MHDEGSTLAFLGWLERSNFKSTQPHTSNLSLKEIFKAFVTSPQARNEEALGRLLKCQVGS